MPKYNVHIFDLFRVRVENIEADSQEKAIATVTGDTGLYDPRDFIPTKETKRPEGVAGVSYIEPSDDGPAYYLVDEVGDEEHTKTKWHPGMFDLDLNEAAPDMVKALDEADTAFAVINICDDLTPQARGALKEAWRVVQDALAKAKPGSAYAEAVKEVRAEETAQAKAPTFGVCPKCGSDEIEGGFIGIEGCLAVQENMGCLSCAAHWHDVYEFVESVIDVRRKKGGKK